MRPIEPRATLRLKFPLGQTVLVALALLAVLAGAAEATASSRWARQRWQLGHTNNVSPYFEEKLSALDRLEAAQGQVDCIVLGSSMVNAAFRPEPFERALAELGHPPLVCANFGVAGLMAWQAGDLARLLVHRYQPRLIIYGTSARDYTSDKASANFGGNNYITRGAWMDYRLRGVFSVEGWLIDHSYAYRNWLGARDWYAGLGTRSEIAAAAAQPAEPIDLSQPPDPERERGGFMLLADYQVAPEALAGLDDLLALKALGTALAVVEMPVHPTYAGFFPRGEADQQAAREAVSAAAARHNVPFWSAEKARIIPANGFHDRNHLGPVGAAAFSQWLAEHVAQIVP